ncbi:MAG: hypothetical protein WD066_13725 [Planctomycetaceae bacterium]
MDNPRRTRVARTLLAASGSRSDKRDHTAVSFVECIDRLVRDLSGWRRSP